METLTVANRPCAHRVSLVRVPERTAGNSYLGTIQGLPGDPEVIRPALLAYLARSKALSQIKSLTDVFSWCGYYAGNWGQKTHGQASKEIVNPTWNNRAFALNANHAGGAEAAMEIRQSWTESLNPSALPFPG
jgi:hypothetical protein